MLNQIAAIHGTGAPAVTNSYESIATVTVGAGGSSSISFTSIPSTYKHLQIRASHTFDSNNRGINFQFNSDTGANYSRHYLSGDGSSANAGGAGSLSNISFYYHVGNAGTTQAEVEIVDILEYANTNIYKTLRGLAGVDNNGSGEVFLVSGSWRNTSAITSVTINTSGGNFAQYSKFALYGIKG